MLSRKNLGSLWLFATVHVIFLSASTWMMVHLLGLPKTFVRLGFFLVIALQDKECSSSTRTVMMWKMMSVISSADDHMI